jgi:triacylglycerol lipase
MISACRGYLTAASLQLVSGDHPGRMLPWRVRRAAKRSCEEAGEGSTVPVVFVHGYLAGRGCWAPMITRFYDAGRGHLRTFGYESRRDDVYTAAAGLAAKVRSVADEHDVERVDVVAHSLGGIVTLVAATRMDLHEHLGSVVTLGSPYGGSPLARLSPGGSQLLRTAQDLQPRSALLADLRDAARTMPVPWTVLWSRHDQLVPEVSATALTGPTVTLAEMTPVGHAEMLYSRQVTRQVLDALSHDS